VLLDEGAARGGAAVSGLRLGLLQYRIERLADIAAFARKLDALVAEGVRGGGDLLVLPEYAGMELAAALTGGPADARAELEAICAVQAALLEVAQDTARRHGVWLLGGALPWRGENRRTRLRAPLIAPDGRVALQDKRVNTRFEVESLGLDAGEWPGVFATPWGTIGVAVCYDVEFPTLVRAQAEAGAWLILAPACTDTLHGFNRVRIAARARALENQCFVAIAPTVGDAPWSATLDANRGFAAVYGPVDQGFPEDGTIAEGRLDADGWLFAELDPARLELVRDKGAVRNFRDWPGTPAGCGVAR
jgi:predicted amidohydrolase